MLAHLIKTTQQLYSLTNVSRISVATLSVGSQLELYRPSTIKTFTTSSLSTLSKRHYSYPSDRYTHSYNDTNTPFSSTSNTIRGATNSTSGTSTSGTNGSGNSSTTNYKFMPDFDMDNVPYIKEWREIMNEMEKRKINTKRLKIILCFIASGVLFVFYDVITSWTSTQVTEITSKSLDDPKFQQDIVEFCENTINKLVMSQKVQQDVVSLLQLAIFELAKKEEVLNILSELFAKVFTSNVVKEAGATLSADVVNKLVKDPEYQELREMVYRYLCEELERLSKDGKVQTDISDLAKQALLNMIWSNNSSK